LARCVFLTAFGLAVFAGLVGVIAQQLGTWPSGALAQTGGPAVVAPSAPSGYSSAWSPYGVAPQPTSPAPAQLWMETIERLPPVTPSRTEPVAPLAVSAAWPAILPPLAPSESTGGAPSAETAPSAAPRAAGPADATTSDAATKTPDIPGDPLPRMFESVVIERAPWFHMDSPWLDLWDGSFEMGLDGSSGNSDTFNIRLGAQAKRKSKRHSLRFELNYHKNTNDSVETANRLYFEGNYERLSERTPWTWFFQHTTEYDEFQPWDVRVVGSSGPGFRFFDTEITTLTARLGGGASQEVGGPDQDCVPEMKYNLEFEHHLTKRQKIGSSIEYFPNIANYGEYRIVSKANWEVLLDAEMNLSLKLTANDRYNYPNPGGKLNDIDYAVVLLWSF
jgi:putative salt-induced outer membrane protein YdiY